MRFIPLLACISLAVSATLALPHGASPADSDVPLARAAPAQAQATPAPSSPKRQVAVPSFNDPIFSSLLSANPLASLISQPLSVPTPPSLSYSFGLPSGVSLDSQALASLTGTTSSPSAIGDSTASPVYSNYNPTTTYSSKGSTNGSANGSAQRFSPHSAAAGVLIATLAGAAAFLL